MKKFSTFILSLLMGLNVFAQNQVLKAIPSAEVKNFKVAETQLKQQSSAKADYRNYIESEAFYTTYDFQSNSYLGNRMYQLNDCSVGVVAMMSSDEQGNFSDRGTGYNFYKEGNIFASNNIPQVREEANATGTDLRTGWPSIAPYGTEGEILVNQANGLQYYTRAKAGEGKWDGPHAIPNPENIDEVVKGDGNALAWARIVTTGENNDVLHVFANASGEENSASYYLRTEDLQNWDIQFSPLEMDNLHINCYAADDYVVSANGNNIAVVYNNWEKAHTMLYKSTDNGLTWESRIIWENPIHGLDWETDEASLFDELYAPAQVSVAMGADGVAHVALSVGLYSRTELGTNYYLHYGLKTDGIAYWNSTYETPLRSPQDDDLRNALRMWTPDPENEGYMFIDFTNFCAMTPPHAEQGWDYFDAQKQYTGFEYGGGDYLSSFGLSAYPAIAVDPAGNLAIAYSAPDVNRGAEYDDQYYYRSIFVNYKPADSATWAQMPVLAPTNFYSDFIHIADECTYVSAVSTPKNVNEFWFSCLTDDTPGFYSASGASQAAITSSVMHVFKFNPTGEINDEPLPESDKSLLFSYEGNIINPTYPTTINITRELNDAMEIQFDLEVTNNTDNPVNIVCEIEDNSGIGSTYVCWGSCYAPGMYNVVNTLDAFSTSMFNGHCMFVDENWNELPKGTTIPVKYTFYDENNPSQKYTFNVNFKNYNPQQQYRNVLIETFTGRGCAFCPDGHRVANQIAADNPERVFSVNIHTQNALSPASYPNLNIDLSASFYNAFNVPGLPTGNINRNSGSAIGRHEWQTQTASQLSQLAEVNIDGKVVINPDTRVAEITVELEYTSSSAYNTNYLTIMMLQDNIIGSQSGSSYNPSQIVDGQYRHMHVLRDVVTSTWGDAVSSTTAGSHIVKTYTYEIPEVIGNPNGVEVDLDNIYFLAFVAETYQGTPTRPILNVNKLEQIEGVDEPVYAFIKDAVQENTSTCSYEKKFVLNIANAGTDNITSIEFEIDVEGGDITEYQWNGFIPSHENTDIDLFAYIPEGEHEVTFRIVSVNGEYFYSEKTILAMSEKIIEVETSDANEQFRLEIAQDRFGNQITWSVVGHNGNIIAEGGPYQMLSTVGTQLHVEYFTLPAGECAEFIINDNVGNGINGAFGQGYYKIYDSNDNVVVDSDGNYGHGESHIIYVNDNGETPETPHYWKPDPSLYANNMTVISTIAIDGVEQSDFNLELGAFCGDEVRGSGKLQYVGAPANRYECFLMVYGNAGDNITFKLYDHATETVSDLKTNQSVTFEVNGAVGDVINPYAINFTSTIVHNQELKSGWNWYSTYIVNEGAEGLANLENAVGTNGIQIKNQSKFVNQAGGNWYGTLTETSVEDMFMIQLSSATNVALEGYEVNPADYPITLGTNWKWISYPLSTEMSVEEAFASANPSNGDYVKSQTGFAQYYDGLGWSGTLKTMTPGMGYMYQNKSGYAKTLVYPTPNNKSASVSESESINHWTVDYSKYPMNMTMIAVVEGAESAYEVAAFVDGECRGSARPIYVEALDSYIMFMTISGEDNEAITFKYYDVNTGETYAIVDEFTFSVNATVGDVMNPYVMTRGTMGIDDLSSSINIYPNPVEEELIIATEVRVEEISIYDVYGRTTTVYGLQTTDFVHSIDVADLEAGVYFVNIKTENGNVVKRFVKN